MNRVFNLSIFTRSALSLIGIFLIFGHFIRLRRQRAILQAVHLAQNNPRLAIYFIRAHMKFSFVYYGAIIIILAALLATSSDLRKMVRLDSSAFSAQTSKLVVAIARPLSRIQKLDYDKFLDAMMIIIMVPAGW
jgi:hypothetical protein